MKQSEYFFTDLVEYKHLMTPQEKEESYRVRYDVYCNDMKFLSAKDYPDGIETDAYDDVSEHIGCYLKGQEMAGTVRLVMASDKPMPLLNHLSVDPEFEYLFDSQLRVAEVSRLCISPHYRRRRNDGRYGAETPSDPKIDATHHRQRTQPIFLLALFRGLYQVSKYQGITHWVIAIERGLHSMLKKNFLPFEAIGPEADYYGMVRPYATSVEKIETLCGRADINYLRAMSDGLPEHLLPELLRQSES